MLVRCCGKEEANEAIKALMRLRMRFSGLMDWNYHWSNPHPGNTRTTPDSVRFWIDEQWKHAQKLDRNAIVPPDKYDEFDAAAIYDLWYVPEWPVSVMSARSLPGGRFRSHQAWIDRLWASIQKHGVKDPVFAYNHRIPGQRVDEPRELARVVQGNNRVAVAQVYGLKTLPVVTTVDKGTVPPYAGRKITLEDYHDGFMNHRADLWATKQDVVLVHPPTVFYDEKDGGNLKPCPL